MKTRKRKSSAAKAFTWNLLRKHFRGLEISQLVTSSRSFPVTARIDLQEALAGFFEESGNNQIVGLHEQWMHETLTVAKLGSPGNQPVLIGPPQYEEVDLGEPQATRCLKQALWLGKTAELPFAVLFTPERRYGREEGMVLEVAIPPGQAGLAFSQDLMSRMERAVAEGKSYRGRFFPWRLSVPIRGKRPGFGFISCGRCGARRSFCRDKPWRALNGTSRSLFDIAPS